jgi:hypothetical protein
MVSNVSTLIKSKRHAEKSELWEKLIKGCYNRDFEINMMRENGANCESDCAD